MSTSESVGRTNDLPRGLAAPARRALAGAKIEWLDQVAALNEEELNHLHGIGPRALDQLRQALNEKGMSFAGERHKEGDRV